MIVERQQIKTPSRIGAMKINHVIYFYLAIILFTPAYTYHMAVSQEQ